MAVLIKLQNDSTPKVFEQETVNLIKGKKTHRCLDEIGRKWKTEKLRRNKVTVTWQVWIDEVFCGYFHSRSRRVGNKYTTCSHSDVRWWYEITGEYIHRAVNTVYINISLSIMILICSFLWSLSRPHLNKFLSFLHYFHMSVTTKYESKQGTWIW